MTSPDIWINRDLPVLIVAVDIYRRTGWHIDAGTLASEAGVDGEVLQAALAVLYRKVFDRQSTLRGDDGYAVVGFPTDAAIETVVAHEKSRPPTPARDVRGIGGRLGRRIEDS